MPCETGRFAPSTTGPAHPGTLLAALLCWLDARSRGGRLVLRLEDLDPDRCRPEWSDAMRRDLDWLGLDFDAVQHQHEGRELHEAALDRLAESGHLYPCRCSRSGLRARAAPAADGGLRYPGTCRARPLPRGGWRASAEPLRVALPSGRIEIEDESGTLLSQDPAAAMGDPVVRRRDGAVAYHLAGVVDDARAGVTRVVRGRDLAASTATQVALQRLLGLPTPRYRHHLLLLERRPPRGGAAQPRWRSEHSQGVGKLAKLHGSISLEMLRPHYDAAALCGVLAQAAGLRDGSAPVPARALLEDFDWQRVSRCDRLLEWTGEELQPGPEIPPAITPARTSRCPESPSHR